jgi:thioredoxin-like negative regulator of GroEL
MRFITSENEIKLENNLQGIYFYAHWLPYHKKMLTMIGKMEDKYKNINFLAVDVDNFSNQCIRFNISSIPTIIILNNGKEIKRINGMVLTSAFKSALADICNI